MSFMLPESVAAWTFAVLAGLIALFQLALAAGAPWGAASMGGKFPGRYPLPMRFVALFNMALLLFFAAVVLTEAGLTPRPADNLSHGITWFIAGYSALGTVMNTITPSKIERIWAPVIAVMFACSLSIVW